MIMIWLSLFSRHETVFVLFMGHGTADTLLLYSGYITYGSVRYIYIDFIYSTQ
jgi:hypothetical protein